MEDRTARMKREAELVLDGMLVKVQPHEWYFRDAGDASEKAMQMASACDLNYHVIEVGPAPHWTGWFRISSVKPTVRDRVIATYVPTPDWPADDPRWQEWEMEHCEGGGQAPRGEPEIDRWVGQDDSVHG
jgi:hypothetical protein